MIGVPQSRLDDTKNIATSRSIEEPIEEMNVLVAPELVRRFPAAEPIQIVFPQRDVAETVDGKQSVARMNGTARRSNRIDDRKEDETCRCFRRSIEHPLTNVQQRLTGENQIDVEKEEQRVVDERSRG